MGLIKNDEEILLIRESCRIVAGALDNIKRFIEPGITTEELDRIIEEFIINEKGIPAFKGYGKTRSRKGFPASACISVNEEVVHGIPGSRKLVEGDIVSVDVGVKKNGYFGDAARTYAVGNVSDKKKKLMKVTEESLNRGIKAAVAGNKVSDISVAVQSYVEGAGFSVVRVLVGHGIGRNLHEDPPVPNFYAGGESLVLLNGMTIAIEPMVNYGTHVVKSLKDGWTIVTEDNEPSAHFEHTILINDSKPEILTKVG